MQTTDINIKTISNVANVVGVVCIFVWTIMKVVELQRQGKLQIGKGYQSVAIISMIVSYSVERQNDSPYKTPLLVVSALTTVTLILLNL